MIGGDLYTVLLEALRALFLIVVPMTVSVTVAGALAGIFQTSTAITDAAIGYALRLVAACAVLYFFFPAFSRAVIDLTELAFQ